jgi:uncharacterized low-complexity protein
MSKKYSQKPLAAALGAAFLSVTASSAVQANENPFTANQLSSGYMQIAGMEGKCGGMKGKEGKCGGKGACGGMMKKMDADGDGNVSRAEFDTYHSGKFDRMDTNKDGMIGKSEMTMGKGKEGKCGEGKCGGMKATEKMEKAKEGKCGEGKCGGNK